MNEVITSWMIAVISAGDFGSWTPSVVKSDILVTQLRPTEEDKLMSSDGRREMKRGREEEKRRVQSFNPAEDPISVSSWTVQARLRHALEVI